MIREATKEDAKAIADIYNHYVHNTIVTFEENALSPAECADRIAKVQTAGLNWLVAADCGRVIGYAYASKWNERVAYKHTAEVSIYLANDVTSQGWGTKLYDALFLSLRKKYYYVVIGCIALPNPVSISFHENFGMKKVAHFQQIGFKFGRWIDVGYWQLQLNAVS